MKVIKSVEDAIEFAKNVKLGEKYTIDVVPTDPEEFLKNEDKYLQLIKEIQDIIAAPFLDKIEVVDNFEKLKRDYPNKTALRKLKEPEIVSLGMRLGIEEVDVKLLATENDTIVIEWFQKNIW